MMKTPYHFALVGGDVSHSRSADIFTAIFKQAGVQGQFDLESVSGRDLESHIRELVLDGVCGFSVTIPHKRSVLAFLDDIDPVARTLGAVNSISVDGHRLYGHNTDCFGFSQPLRLHREALAGKQALVLGCGGAARAVVYALWKDFCVKRFLIAGRSQEHLDNFRAEMASVLANAQIETTAHSGLRQRPPRDLFITVNCTPMGGSGQPDATPLPDSFDFRATSVYYDLNYNRPNQNVARAAAGGCVAIDGAAMLVGQAVRSFAIWTGQTIECAPVFEAVFGAK